MTAPLALRFQARQLYKEVGRFESSIPFRAHPLPQLLYLAKNYPGKPIEKKLHTCFSQFIGGDEAKVLDGIKKAEYIKKELEMLYYIKKYRAMKSAYSKGVEW